jgi:hypothetical protein
MTKCQFAVELESESGYRFWSGGMDEDKVNDYIDNSSYGLSDVDHVGDCFGTCSDPL